VRADVVEFGLFGLRLCSALAVLIALFQNLNFLEFFEGFTERYAGVFKLSF